MKKNCHDILLLFVRYFSVVLLGIGNLYLFYKVFTPLTTWSFYGILSIFNETSISGQYIYFGEYTVRIINACVAGAAYYLLFALAMTTSMKWKARAKVVATSFGIFFGFNLIRLLILSLFLGNSNFEILHWILWHVISTIFVVTVWFTVVKIYKVRAIPAVDDFKFLKKFSKPKRKSKNKGKSRVRNKKHK